MSVNKSFNGVTYAIPNTAAESGWGTSLSNFLQAVADNAALKTTHKQNVRQALTSPITISATSDWCVDIRVGSIPSAVTLPAGVEGQTFLVVDGYGLFGTNNCTVTATTGTIQGAGTYVMNHNYQATLFQWSNDRWNVVAEHLGPFIKPEKVGNGTVSFTEFLRLASLTSTAVGISDTQTLTNKTISTTSNTIGPLDSVTGTLSVSKGGTGLTAVGSALQVLRTNAGGTALEYATAGSGDVVGPASATDNAIARFDGTTGKLVQNSDCTISDTGAVTLGPATGASLTHTIQSGGGTTLLNLTSSAGAFSTQIKFNATGGGNGGILIPASGGFTFRNNTDTATFGEITTSGVWTLGPSSGATAGHVIQSSVAASTSVIYCRKHTGGDTTSNYYLTFTTDTTIQGYIWNNAAGNIELLNSSDVNLKENIRDADYGLNEVLALRPVKFDWKTGAAQNVKGFIAQEVQLVLPGSVTQMPDGNLGMGTHELIPVMVKAIQELKAELDVAKARIEALENK